MITRLHHVQITIPKDSEEKARDFYCGLLGLTEIEKPEELKGRGGFWLQLGEVQVHIGVEEDVDRHATKAHIAYEVNDVAFWTVWLREQGIGIIEPIQIPGFKRVELRDPFGNRIELIQPIE